MENVHLTSVTQNQLEIFFDQSRETFSTSSTFTCNEFLIRIEEICVSKELQLLKRAINI